jgi:DNA mismatch repair ATPase MutS
MKVYQDNVEKYQAEITGLDNSLKRLSTLRLVVFMFSAIILVFLANERLTASMLIVGPLCVFAYGVLVRRYNDIATLKGHTTFLKEINEREVLRLENKLSEFPTGQTYVNAEHSYVSDLDIFGQHSLFQLINRTTTGSGEALLAEWLSAPPVKGIILERQQAVKELSPKLDWRHHFQAAGMEFKHTRNDYDKLLAWMEKPVRFLQRQSKYLLLIIPLSILSTGAVIYFFIEFLFLGNLLGAVPLAIMLLVNGLVLTTVRPLAEEILENIQRDIKILNAYQSLIMKVELEKFNSKILQRLQTATRRNNHSAAAEINRLKRILEVFQLRGRKRELNHQFYSAFNNLWFLDVYLIILTEKWKNKNGSSIDVWVSAISEFEVLSSLAGFHYSNPTFTFPDIKDDSYSIHFEMLGHPLISAKKRVCNGFSLNGRGEIAMITGSNMAGKSTFLRTVGVNMVLALTGAPCCAKYGQLSHLKIFTSMRTQDSLKEGVSSFYAELKRIEQLLKLIQSGQPIFFLLDEMFKGTNSKDRHRGGFSLIKQLKELNAFGIISTHDLDLAILAGADEIVTNYSFNSSIREGEMIFNHILTEGLCSDFNAGELMKRSGIKVLPYIDGNQ